MNKKLTVKDKMNKFVTKAYKLISIESLIETGKSLMILIGGAMIINYWLEFVMNFPDSKYKSYLYAITFLIPTWISYYVITNLFCEEENE